MEDRQLLLIDEGLIVRHGGEIPEIAYYNSLYFLTTDPQGPGLTLAPPELDHLREQAVARYREIILRDLAPANRDRPLYRGMARVIWNWRRLLNFLQRHDLPPRPELEEEVVAALRVFLDNERQEVRARLRTSCLNCTADELAGFLRQMNMIEAAEDADAEPAGQIDRPATCRQWLALCNNQGDDDVQRRA